MSRRAFSSVSVLILLAVSFMSLGGAQAGSTSTPGKIVKWFDDGVSLTDSAISEDPAASLVGITGMNLSLDGSVPVFNGVGLMLLNRAGGNTNPWVVGTGGLLGPHFFSVGDSSYYRLVIDDRNGNVGIGTVSPQAKLDVGGSVHAGPYLTVEGNVTTFNGTGVTILNRAEGNTNPWVLGTGGLLGSHFFSVGDSFAYRLVIDDRNGNVGVGTLSPQAKLDVAGMTRTGALQITGGADFSEKFEVANTQSKIEPGMVVAIHPHDPGKLSISSRPYDRRVAGVISGAGGVQPGMLMAQSGTLADGDQPVALSGRVYVWADTSNGPITQGDLLTTSTLAGHAMKVTDHGKAKGATLGKAMTELRQGRGLVLTLVTLQ